MFKTSFLLSLDKRVPSCFPVWFINAINLSRRNYKLDEQNGGKKERL